MPATSIGGKDATRRLTSLAPRRARGGPMASHYVSGAGRSPRQRDHVTGRRDTRMMNSPSRTLVNTTTPLSKKG